MKEISIFVDGKYEPRFKNIKYVYYLSYKTAVIKRAGNIIQEGSPARAQLQSLYLALQRVTEPCTINIYSKRPLGFENPKECNNKDLIAEIWNLICKAGHIINFKIDKEFYQVQIWEQTYGSKAPEHEKAKESLPDIEDKESINDVFAVEEENILDKRERLRREYEELYNDTSVWVPGSGGY